MGEFGQTAYAPSFPSTSGRVAGVIANPGSGPRYKVGGLTLDWGTVLAAVADATDALTGDITKAGQKTIRFGTILCRINATTFGGVVGKYAPYSAPMTADALNGALAVGGTTATLTTGPAAGIINPGDWLTIAAGAGGTIETIQVKSYVVGTKVVTFNTALAQIHGDTAAVTKGDDGRQTLRRGECFVLDNTIIQGQTLDGLRAGGCFDGGCTVYLERVARDYGSYGVPANPTRAILEAGFPDLTWLIN